MRIAAFVACLGAFGAVACSSTKADSENLDPPVRNGADAGRGVEASDAGASPDAEVVTQLTILPQAVHSGFDGVHAYKVPIGVYGARSVRLSSSDPSVVRIEPAKITDPALASADAGQSFLLTMKKAGTVTLTAEAGGQTATAQLTVAAYSAARWQVGETRYKSGANGEPACTQCHGQGTNVDHSPTALAAAEDNAVTTVITTGILVAGDPIRGVSHRWQATRSELEGLVTYLRALPPRGYEVAP